MFSRNDIERLKAYFITTRGDNIAQGEITPKTTDTYDLGRPAQRWDTIYASAVVADSLSGNPTGSHSSLSGLDQDDHTQYVHISTARTITAQHQFAPGTTAAPFTLGANAQGQVVTGLLADHVNKEVIAGLGLTGGGLLTTGSSITLTVSLGTGLGFNGDNIELAFSGTPTTIEPDDAAAGGSSSYAARVDHVHSIVAASASGLDVTSLSAEGSATSFSRSDHTHAISTSSNPSTTRAILATDTSGHLQLDGLGIGVAPIGSPPLIIQDSSSPLRLQYNGSNYWDFSINSSGTMTMYGITGGLILSPTGDLVLNPTTNDVVAQNNYDINLGTPTVKYLAIHAAELWVENLVAQDTIATIGGRVLVGSTTEFIADRSSTAVSNEIENPGFETAGGGGADVFANWVEAASDGAIAQAATDRSGSGSYSAKLTAGASTDTVVYQLQGGYSPGDDILFRFWTRSEAGDTSVGRYAIWDASNGAYIVSPTNAPNAVAGSTTWYENRIIFEIPVGCTTIHARLLCPSVATDIAYFDDVLLTMGVQIDVKHNEMAPGDICYAEYGGQLEFFQIIAGPHTTTGGYYYEVDRDLDETGANSWIKGQALFNTGAADEGFIDLYAINAIAQSGDTTGPTIVGWVRNSTHNYIDISEHWAIGNLKGVYGETINTYGVGLGDYDNGNYLKYTSNDGEFVLKNTAGDITIDVNGISIEAPTDWLSSHSYQFVEGGSGNTVVGRLAYKNYGGGTSHIALETMGEDSISNVNIKSYGTSTANADIRATDGVNYSAIVNCAVDVSGSSVDITSMNTHIDSGEAVKAIVRIDGGLRVGDDLDSTDNDIRAIADVTAGGGVMVGDVNGEPTDGTYCINDTNTRLSEGAGNSIRLQTDSGYIDVGAQSTSYGHIYTDRAAILLNKHLYIPSTSGLYVGANSGATAGYIKILNTISASNSAMCRVFRNSNQSIATATWDAIEFNSTSYDDYGWHDATSSDSQIIPLFPGKYYIWANVEFSNSDTDGVRQIRIKKNGTTNIAYKNQNALTISTRMDISCVVEMNGSTDYIELEVYQNSGSSIDIVTQSRYSPDIAMFRIP